MQTLLNKICYFNTPDAKGLAWSPFVHEVYRKDLEDKRSRLFPDRKRIPGRKTKFILTIVYLIHIYTLSKFFIQKKFYNNKAEQQRQIQRRISPFFQSIQDIQYTTLKHRNDLIFIEAFKKKGGAKYLQKFNRFNHHPNLFVPSSGEVHSIWQKAGTERTSQSGQVSYHNRYLTGYNIQNI